MVALAPAQVPADDAARPAEHIVDTLIAERAPRLRRSAMWPIAKPLLYRLLDYATARRMADDIAGMGGREALDHVSRLLDVKFVATKLDRIPPAGRLMIVCNHPTGLADGIAVYDALRTVRPDAVFYANSDAHRVAARLDEVLIPVEWVEAKRTRERTRLTLKMSQETFEAERALVIFPAGRISRKRDGRLADPDWQPTPVAFARKYNAPVTPIHVAGPWSFLFHAFDGLSQELRDITLFHELLNKKGRTFRLTVGRPIAPEQLQGDPAEVILRLKTYTEQILPTSPDQPFA